MRMEVSCEHCDSEDVVRMLDGVFRCYSCGEFFGADDDYLYVEQPRRRRNRWDDDDDEY